MAIRPLDQESLRERQAHGLLRGPDGHLFAVETPAASWLLCRVRSRFCAIPIESVIETSRPLSIAPVAGSPAYVLGLSVVRGEPVPVIDAAQLLSMQAGEPTRFVMVRAGDRRIALAVDGVLGIRDIPVESLRQLPPLLGAAQSDVIAAIGTVDAELLLVLRSARIVPEETWQALQVEKSLP